MNITDIIDKYEPDAFMHKNMQGNRTVSFNGVATADWSVSTLYTRPTVEKMLGEVFSEELRDVLFGNLWSLETAAEVLYEAGYPGANQGVLLLHQALSTLRENCAALSPAKEQG